MLRISETAIGRQPLVKLEGKLLSPWVSEVLTVCNRLRASPTVPLLDLAGLTFVDGTGANLLRDLIRQGFNVARCSGYVQELLQREPR